MLYIFVCRPNYDTSSDVCKPLTYTSLLLPLAERAVRLCVLPLQDSQEVVQTASKVTEAIKALLPAGEFTDQGLINRLHEMLGKHTGTSVHL